MTAQDDIKTFTVHTDCLFDSKNRSFIHGYSIVVNPKTGLIEDVYRRQHTLPDKIERPDVDLRGKCVLPGLVDAHTHIFLHPESESASLNQMRDESLVERIIRATRHCQAALLAGYTTYRDLGTEAAGDADVHVRDAINRGITPGPRIFCATKVLASSGGYDIRQENAVGGTTVPSLSDACDGIVGVRAAVRRRLGAGADVIKFCADYRKRQLRFPRSAWKGCADIMFPPEEERDYAKGKLNDRNPSLLLFQQEEMNEIVREARVARAPVAAHAMSDEAVVMAARAGVTSIEHGYEPWVGMDAIKEMKANGVIYVPTISVAEPELKDLAPVLAQVRKAFEAGIKIAAGGDTGSETRHGDNVRELELLLKAEVPVEEILVAATLNGWQACGGDWCGRRFGWIGTGWAADIVAMDGDVRRDFSAMRRVQFVMKDGKVWKRNGHAVGFLP